MSEQEVLHHLHVFVVSHVEAFLRESPQVAISRGVHRGSWGARHDSTDLMAERSGVGGPARMWNRVGKPNGSILRFKIMRNERRVILGSWMYKKWNYCAGSVYETVEGRTGLYLGPRVTTTGITGLAWMMKRWIIEQLYATPRIGNCCCFVSRLSVMNSCVIMLVNRKYGALTVKK